MDISTESYIQKMSDIMKAGRFGERNACRMVYMENAELFQQWRDGASGISFYNYETFLNDTKLYQAAYSVETLGDIYPQTQTGCINSDCVDVADMLIARGYNPAILNLASAKKPCGGYREGLGAQEESLCRSSNLSQSLYQFGDPKYVSIRESGAPVKMVGYPLDINFGGIYTPNVTFFRNNKARFFTLRDRPFHCDVITVAALSFNGKSNYSSINELQYRASSGGFTPDGEEIMLNKIRTIFRMGVEHGKDALVLGAFGCGAYKLPVSEVVKLFRMVMNEPEFANKFRLLVFAIRERPSRPNGINGKYAEFYREFGAYTPD